MDERLQQATEQLGRALRASAPMKAYLDASTDLETDAEATNLLDELAQHQAALRVKQNAGGLTQAAIDDLRALQFRVQTQPTIAPTCKPNKTCAHCCRKSTMRSASCLE